MFEEVKVKIGHSQLIWSFLKFFVKKKPRGPIMKLLVGFNILKALKLSKIFGKMDKISDILKKKAK